MNPIAFLLAIISTIGFGTTTICTTKVTRKVGAIASLFLYQLVGIPLFLFLIPLMPKTPSSISLWPLFALGAFDAFSYLLFMIATKVGEVSILGTIIQFYMVVTTLLGVVFLHESFHLYKILGLILIFAGIVLFGLQLSGKNIKSVKILQGVPLAFISSIGVGIYLFFVAIVTRTDGWFLTALVIRIAITITTGILLLFQRISINRLIKETPWKAVGLAAVLDVIAFSVYNIAVGRYEVSSVTMVVATQPVVMVILANKLFGERLSRRQIIGFCIILAGLISLQLH
ncbi:MAG TPA: DMT family transporter [Patescibacteria group bacterium]|jgi:drug/metabolite transporter (DMT)-like permease|nr:DMT family transporter [Patescibacteria group bacterium]